MIDTHSETWEHIRKTIHARLEADLLALQTLNCDPRMGDVLRGEIQLAKYLLQLPEREKNSKK